MFPRSVLTLPIRIISACLSIHKKKRIYQINDKDFKNRPKGFYTTFNSISKKVNYFNKDFKEVIANFVGIEIVCLRYNSSFFFKL